MFEKIAHFRCMNFMQHLTYNLRGAWYTQYAILFSNYKRDNAADMLL